MDGLARTPLFDLHERLGARIVGFAGHAMPVQFAGVLAEHTATRQTAGLFDVSHMGQVLLSGPDVALAFETLVPQDIAGLAEGRQRYGFFTNDAGGIEDDLMIANRGDHHFVVVNAARVTEDLARMRAALEPRGVTVTHVTDRALVALQGPGAEAALAALAPETADMAFLDVATVTLAGAECWVSRSGYTGEDGFEISVPAGHAETLAKALLSQADVHPAGLGARDALRLEAGLCLYGQDIDAATTPVEAGLGWAIQKVRRHGGARAGGFPGAAVILDQMEQGTTRHRVGLRPAGRAPMRSGVTLYDAPDGGAEVGQVTSGSFGATLGAPVSMGYVAADLARRGVELWGEVRGKQLPVTVTDLPFVPPGFKR